jgi:diguanylate cyclase (GGDEF)-like protein
MLAVDSWPEAGRHPFFRLDLPPGQARDVYVRIRHTTAADFPIQFNTVSRHNQRIQLEYVGLGLTFGALLVLIVSCLSQSWVYRDGVYAWYSAYATTTALAVASYTGVAAHLLWPGFGALGDAPQASLAYLTSGAALLFVRNVIGIPARHLIADRLVQLLGLLGFALAAAHPLFTKMPGLALLTAYMVVATLLNLSVSLSAWRRGDPVGMWVFVSFAPVLVSMTIAAVRMFGWLPVSFFTQYAIVFTLALQVPLLLVALSIRSRERHGAQIREQALSTQDALTGLLAPHLFHDRLRQVVARFKRDGEDAVVVFIDLVNYPRIKNGFGSAVAEQSLLRTVIKLRRLLRDVDTVSRIGEARFGVILEGIHSRIAITDRAARLIAAGLMPLKGLKPDVTLQFHIGAVLLQERMLEAEELVDALGELLGHMSPRTRRPIRFLQPDATQPASLPDSSLLSADDEQQPKSDKQPLAIVR